MTSARKTLAIVAFAAMVGCTAKAPAATPGDAAIALRLHTSEATQAYMQDLSRRYALEREPLLIDLRQGHFSALLAGLEAGGGYIVSSHLPSRADFWAAPLALDALAIITHPANGISGLTIAELRDAFSGRQDNWRAWGGRPGSITPLSYQAGSDVALEFERLVMGVASVSGNAMQMPNFESMRQRASELEGAIGYLPLSQVGGRVKTLAIAGVYPSEASVADRRYPLVSTIYIIGRQPPSGASARFFSWAQSVSGANLVADAFATLP